MQNDTIAAISTPPGTGAIGIVRMTGPDVAQFARRLFRSPQGHFPELKSHQARYGQILEPLSERILDFGLLLYMQAPRSFTGEDMLEIHCHGGYFLVQQVLSACLNAGARPAEAGEFSRRAFLNGKLDLTQAEAISDLIEGQSREGLHLAAHQLEGQLSNPIRQLRQDLLGLLASIEANIDFPDEVDPLPESEILETLENINRKVALLLASRESGRIWKQGIQVALVGEPNVGKSTLLNALLRFDRAIVSDIAGTTRDTLEEDYSLKGIPVKLIDTAGLRESQDKIEQIGIERSLEALEKADLVLALSDAQQPLSLPKQLLDNLSQLVILRNKSDLLPERPAKNTEHGHPVYWISAATGLGIEELEHILFERITENLPVKQDISINERHRLCLLRAQEALERVSETISQCLPSDFLAIDLKEAIQAFGEIMGESVSEHVIHEIFHRFCVGK